MRRLAKKKGPDSLCTVKGMVMTLEERNRLMKLEYINNGKSLKDIADEYGLSHQTLKGLSSKERWSEQRESQRVRFEQDVENKLRDALLNTTVEVNVLYNNAWQMVMFKAKKALATGEGITDKFGRIDVYKLDKIADILTKSQTGQNLCNGFISATDKAKIDIQREQMDLKKMILGMSDDTVIEDNFLECLNQAAERCGITEKLDLLDVEDDD